MDAAIDGLDVGLEDAFIDGLLDGLGDGFDDGEEDSIKDGPWVGASVLHLPHVIKQVSHADFTSL